MTNVIDLSAEFTEITKHNQQERMIAERLGLPVEPEQTMQGYRVFYPDENGKDPEEVSNEIIDFLLDL